MHKDFEELLSVFNAHGVRYLIVGGYAATTFARVRRCMQINVDLSPAAEGR